MRFTDKGAGSRGEGLRQRGQRLEEGAERIVNPSESYWGEPGGHLNSLATSAGPQKWIVKKKNKRKVHCAFLMPEQGKLL